ncbi:MAG: FAD-dependent thymidylate synthase [Hyphomicrobiaceae bacterium]|nr:FAD-dependent thymidylate synthase [Hyphomicrobiaceae bacterium]
MQLKVQRSTEAQGPTSIEQLVNREIKVLDHGFVRVVDLMGSDAAVVQAARVSYGKGTKKTTEDRGLIRYLMKHRHSTPFEMCEIKLHVKLPIFVARQWVRHRTANINEYSARYSLLDKEFYLPDESYLNLALKEQKIAAALADARSKGQNDLFGTAGIGSKGLRATAAQSKVNKQGRETVLEESEALDHLSTIKNLSEKAYRDYKRLLNRTADDKIIDEKREGLARELARMVLPTNYYTQWYWKTDLHNLFHFISLRADSHAQYEIQEYAKAIADVVAEWVPFSYEAFVDYRQGAQTLSKIEVELVKQLLSGLDVEQETSGLSVREWKEFASRFALGEKSEANVESKPSKSKSGKAAKRKK